MSIWLKEQITFWFNSEFYAIGTSAFAGTAIRMALLNYLDTVTVKYPTTEYGPFMEMFITQSYLLPNFLGCFIMACCIVNMKKLSAISVPTYKFLTTGMCGCITTYSSWINLGIDKEFGSTSWDRYLIMIVIQIWLTWSAFTFGYAFVKNIEESPLLQYSWSWLVNARSYAVNKSGFALDGVKRLQRARKKEEALIPDSEKERSSNGTADDVTKANTLANSAMPAGNVIRSSLIGPGGGGIVSSGVGGKRSTFTMTRSKQNVNMILDALCEEDGSAAGDSDSPLRYPSTSIGARRSAGVNRQSRFTNSQQRRSELDLALSEDAFANEAGGGGDENDPNEDPVTLNPISGRISVFREHGIKQRGENIRVSSMRASQLPSNNEVTKATPPSAVAQPAPVVVTAENVPVTFSERFLSFFQQNEWYIWCSLFWCVAIPIWVTLALMPEVDYYDNKLRRETYRSIALAPLGVWVRWGLTRFPSLKALWPAMNPQTMTANLFAVTFECCLDVFSTSSWVLSINDGKYFGSFFSRPVSKDLYLSLLSTMF
jgi:fluoride ion exporter CrcB/FEX